MADSTLEKSNNIVQHINRLIKKKNIAENEDSLRDLWENIKCHSILIIGVPEDSQKLSQYDTGEE